MICVFAGSAAGVPDEDLALSARVGAVLAANGQPVVYGGGSTGCMGAMAQAVLDAGGRVIGVVPTGLFSPEDLHASVELVETDSMHHRKQVMLELADAFVVLPGGLGTFDEVGEVLTWAQLGIHDKVTVFVDPDGFWAGLLDWIDHAVVRGYVSVPSRDFFRVVPDADDVLAAIEAFVAPRATRGPLTPDQA
ncbi:MAG: TIGR00730 family Rossman fold protein [Actinobacteria bacterium]|nr:TIGR00730 family Rossman fold protein [Actinomycetota bacterium]